MKLDYKNFKYSDEEKGIIRNSRSQLDLKSLIQSYFEDIFNNLNDRINNLNNESGEIEIFRIYKDVEDRMHRIKIEIDSTSSPDSNADLYLKNIFFRLKKIQIFLLNKITNLID